MILFTAACTDKFEKRQFYAMGTLVEITHKKDSSLKQVIRTINEYEEQVKSFEEKYNSAPAGSAFDISPLWEILFKKSYDYKAISKDRFDIRALSSQGFTVSPKGRMTFRPPKDTQPRQTLLKTCLCFLWTASWLKRMKGSGFPPEPSQKG
ncbi:MAG: hypothetical protein LRY51_07345 [Geovibrio sp.]|nr:hypothetical protein [Geovibrio sp.]